MTCDYGTGPDACPEVATHWISWSAPSGPARLCEAHTAPIYEDQKDPTIGPYIKIRPLKETND